MNKPTKQKQPQPPPQKENKSKQETEPTSPSRSADNKPVSENDDSPNLFEEHIREKK
jgi:hypothetical protein